MHRAKYEGVIWSSCDNSGHATLTAPPCFHHHNALQTPSLRVFMDVPLHKLDWLNHCPWVISSISTPSPLPRIQWLRLKVPTLSYKDFIFLETRLYPEALEDPLPGFSSFTHKRFAYHPGDLKACRSLMPGPGDKDQMFGLTITIYQRWPQTYRVHIFSLLFLLLQQARCSFTIVGEPYAISWRPE